jgi:cytochrome bd ubiquinol oxidase subunit I
MAKHSIIVAGVFGLLSSLMVAFTGDHSARTVSKIQPVKFASMEALYNGKSNAGLIAFGILKDTDKKIGDKKVREFAFKIQIPDLLSVLTGGERQSYVQGLTDHISGNQQYGIISTTEKIQSGKYAREALETFKKARSDNDTAQISASKSLFRNKEFNDKYFRYFGYASIDKPEDVIPSVTASFYSFHLMVVLGFLFIMIFSTSLFLLYRGTLLQNRWFLWIALFSIPLPYIAGELGWLLTELGRQPWIIQDLMTVSKAVSQISTGSVITTFILFAVLFTGLLISEVSILVKQIKTGPKH